MCLADHGNSAGGSGSSSMRAGESSSSSSKRRGVKEWQELLPKMKGKLKKIPSLTSSEAEVRKIMMHHTVLSRILIQ